MLSFQSHCGAIGTRLPGEISCYAIPFQSHCGAIGTLRRRGQAEEAAQLLMMSKDDFIVFRDAESRRVAVIYKRQDGHFGLIEP